MLLRHSRENDLLKSLCNKGNLERAVNVLLQNDTSPSPDVYIHILKACHKKKALNHAKQVQNHLLRSGKLRGLVADYLIMTLAKCGAPEDALLISQRLPRRTVYSWTALISAFTECGHGVEALNLYQLMQNDGIQPNDYTFVSLLKACGSLRKLEEGRKLHSDARRLGFGSDIFVCTTLVSMYGKCGAISEAEDVFTDLVQRDVVAWNAMLAAYVEHALPDKALILYRQMHEERVDIDQLMFVIALQACGGIGQKELKMWRQDRVSPLDIVRALHCDALRAGFLSGAFIFSTLVNVYSKCGSIAEAEDAFTKALSQRNSVTWNVMISAYFDHGQEIKALQLYGYMHEEGTPADQYTFAIALQACGLFADKEKASDVNGKPMKVMSLEMGKALHADAQRMAFESDMFVSNTLIRIYGKCGAIVDAEDIFCKLYHRDIVSWNALLSVYLEDGEGEKALCLYAHLQQEGLDPDRLALAMALRACGVFADTETDVLIEGRPTKVKSLEIGSKLHEDARRMGLASDVMIGDALIRMYSSCRAIQLAEDVFNSMRGSHDVRSWTAMLSSYVEQNFAEKALELFSLMSTEGIRPDQHTYVMALHACSALSEIEDAIFKDGKVVSLEIGRAIHADVRKKGFASDVFINNTLVSMYGKCGDIASAEEVFSEMPSYDEISWNSLLSVYFDQGEKVLQLYKQMHVEGFIPNQLTFVIALQACSTLSETANSDTAEGVKALCFEIGKAIHHDAQRKGQQLDPSINNTLISMYGKCGGVQESEHVFKTMGVKDPASWTSMLSVYVEQGLGGNALELYSEMQKQGAILDDVTLLFLLQSSSSLGSLNLSRQQHFILVAAGYDLDLTLSASLIHSYGSCASIADVEAVFDCISQPHIAIWNASITSYAGEGDFETSGYMFSALKLMGLDPDEVTYIVVLRACNHVGLTVQALEYFEHMTRMSGLIPDVKHYGILIDLLGRAGNFERAEDMLKHMPISPDMSMWLSLLGACRIHGSLEAGERLFNLAVNKQPRQPKQAAAYVLMSNMYAEAGLQDCATELENVVWR